MKNQKAIGLSLSLAVATMALASQASAASLSQSSFIAGKSISIKVKDDAGVDITAQTTLSYPGSELKISTFAGKPTIQGITAGSNYDIVIKNTASGAVVGDAMVSVAPAAFYKLAIFSGNNQSIVAGTQAPIPLEIQAQDLYRNGVPGQSVSVSLPSGPISLTSDSQGMIQIPYTAGSVSKTETISAVDGASSVSFTEKVVAGPNGIASVKLSGVPSSVDAGASFSVSAKLFDASGAAAMSSGAVVLTGYSNNTCTKVDSNIQSQTSINSNGVISFSGISDSAQESIYLGVSAGGHSACSSVISVKPALGAVSAVIFNQAPTSGKSGVSLFPPTTVQLRDSNSRTVTTSSDAVTVSAFSDAACSAVLPASGNSGAALSGSLTFNSLKITAVGTAYIQASANGVKSNCLGPITLASSAPPPVVSSGLTLGFYAQRGPSFDVPYIPTLLLSSDFGTTFSTTILEPTPGYEVNTVRGSGSNLLESLRGVSPDTGADIYQFKLSKDKGKTYQEIAAPFADLKSLSTADISGNNLLFAGNVGDDSHQAVAASFDGGLTYSDITIPAVVDGYMHTPMINGSNILMYFQAPVAEIMISKDKGQTFNQVNVPYSDAQDVFATMDGDTIFVDSYRQGYSFETFSLSKDGGQTYSDITIPNQGNPDYQFTSAVVSGSNILLKMYGPTNILFFLSKDNGQSFNELTMPISDVLRYRTFFLR